MTQGCATRSADRRSADRSSASPGPDAGGGGGVVRSTYGSHPSQAADLHLPAGTSGELAVVVVIHGGYWLEPYDRSLGTPLAADLAAAGVAAFNIDYRRIGEGDYPATLLDVAAAIDSLADLNPRLDVSRVAAVGHSAGGQLAIWAASRSSLPDGAPGAGPRVRLRGAVSQAGVLDLVRGAEDELGSGAVARLLGGSPAQVPERYAVASPWALVPIGVPVVAVHGTADDIVPLEQSRRYVARAVRAGDSARLVEVAGADHFAMIDVGTESWAVCRREVLALLETAG